MPFWLKYFVISKLHSVFKTHKTGKTFLQKNQLDNNWATFRYLTGKNKKLNLEIIFGSKTGRQVTLKCIKILLNRWRCTGYNESRLKSDNHVMRIILNCGHLMANEWLSVTKKIYLYIKIYYWHFTNITEHK